MYPIRLLNKRDKGKKYPYDLLIIDIDRTCPVLGNPIELIDKDDDDERESVINQYEEYFNKQYQDDVKFYNKIQYILAEVQAGKKVALRCWCHPRQCHGRVIISKINKMLDNKMSKSLVVKGTPEFLIEKYNQEDIDYTECRFVIHIPKKGSDRKHDWHMVKELIHFKDGTSAPNVRYVKNFQKTFWVTAPNLRASYKQKREWEYLDRLVECKSTESDVIKTAARALGKWEWGSMPHLLKDSPHVYGLDIPSTVAIKHEYYEKMKGRKDTPFSIAYSDTETNMIGIDEGASKHIIMQSLFFEGKLYTVILKKFLETVPDPQVTLREMYDTYMPNEGKELVDEWVIELVDEPIDIVKRILRKCHDVQPDFLSFWNMIFDLDKMIECVENAGYDVEEIFCDPRLPKEMRHAFLKRANPSKTSASGKTQTKKPADQWHSFLCPASFYIIDQMASYRFIRKSKQLETEYNLDYILGKELKGLSKLKFKQAEGLTKAEFHIFLQKNYPGEYCIYHAWDAVCMKKLTTQTKDLDYSLPGTTEFSDFMSFESEPKRYMHKFHFYMMQQHGAVSGVSGKSLVQPYDEMTITGKGHIVTLEPHMTLNTGLYAFKDYPGLRTNLYGHAGDLDVKSSYPFGQWVFNMSRMTTVRELINIEGVRDSVRRTQGLNLSGGRSNAVEFCTEIFGMPPLSELSKIYDEVNS